MYRLAILISHPIQYHTPLFQALSKHPEIDLTVYYCWDFGVNEAKPESEFGVSYKWDIPLLDGYKYKFLNNLSPNPSSKSFWGQINPGIIREIRENKYDALWVHGYSFLTDWLAFFAAKAYGTPLFLRGVAHVLDKKSLLIRMAKRIILPFLFKICTVCLYIGENHKKYYQFYGVPDEKLFFIPHVVGNKFFSNFYKQLKPERKKIRREFGFPDNRPVILFVGKFIPKKRPLWVLESYKQVRKRFQCGLLYAGDGPLRREIERRVVEEDIPDVYITGFLNQTEIPKAYIAGDMLILPSGWGETWGLVVNEAMSFGLPIIISNKVGASGDLVQNGKNGYIINSEESLVDVMEKLVSNKALRERLGEASLSMIKDWNVDLCVSGIIEAMIYAKNKKHS